jgi:ribose-phosphate pyrophosphokinase
MKTQRGAITARMIANLLHVAGVDHVITIDLHSSQMQGFFRCPVDNLVAEPLIANWIKRNVPDWKNGVVVSKNAGGTRRVTSLADVMALDFAIITTDRRRVYHYIDSEPEGTPSVFDRLEEARRQQEEQERRVDENKEEDSAEMSPSQQTEVEKTTPSSPRSHLNRRRTISNDLRRRAQTSREIISSAQISRERPSSPLAKSIQQENTPGLLGTPLMRARTEPVPRSEGDHDEEYTDEVCMLNTLPL